MKNYINPKTSVVNLLAGSTLLSESPALPFTPPYPAPGTRYYPPSTKY